MIEAGTVLQNRYRIDKKIGQGGMGAVFVATDERFGSTVAIKETFFTDEGYRKAFEREARLLNNLRHPALPRVSDHFIEENGQFLVMEYITGDDLSEKLEATLSPFPIKDVINWADQLLDALDFLHTQEMPVIHRDIKPQNLKLTPRGQIILLDFGLAKGNPTDSKSQTAAHSVFGYSRSYASLEQIQGTGTDPRSDLYSLAATLYHLLTGIPPIDALTRAMTVLNGEADPLPSADKIHKQVPASVAEVLSRAMALNANHRPSSAAAMQVMLAEAKEDVVEGLEQSISKPSSANLLMQNTEIFENSPSRNTKQGTIETEIMPLAVSDGAAVNRTQTELPRVSLFENDEDNSVVTKVGSIKPATETQKYAEVNDPKSSKRGKALAATALGGFLLLGSAAGALYVFKPEVFQQSDQNSNTVIEKQEYSADSQSNSTDTANSVNTNSSVNSAEKATINTIITKKDNPQKNGKTAVAETSTAEKNNTKPETPETSSTKRNPETMTVIDDDGEEVKMNANRIETKDVIIDNGRIIWKNGKRPSIKRPQMPDLKDLTPEQRQKVLRIMRRQNPPPTPPDDQP